MAPLKKTVCQHLRSAKEWLTKAEEAFDKQHDIRGELDVMLAQAELQHVKEVSRSQQWRYKYDAFRHGLALSLAMFVVVALGGVYWWTNTPKSVTPVPIERQASVPVEVVPKEVNAAPAVLTKENNPPMKQVVNEIVKPLPKTERIHQAEPSVVVSADEMQKLVRAAGKSLRGQ